MSGREQHERDRDEHRFHHVCVLNPDVVGEGAERERCDLIAMATHGHRLLEDVVKGSTATALRHLTKIPVLMVRADKK